MSFDILATLRLALDQTGMDGQSILAQAWISEPEGKAPVLHLPEATRPVGR